ncbi:hypothetical protein HDE68_003950 [Pedobacter cryoconitis]|uniref:ParB/Sulfiredoxin domain-containing protein n=1 Tax=Pedobacter cryoconitis TaxID=188932 RepID=A0A7W8ZPX4_9SPHI|nr:hypothetical protein [Pedobacter cryoconitis]MBB5638024.1 hypothetical protein [Pedobacter cryoconitis]
MKIQIKWIKDPEEHDYPAATSYLSLIYADPEKYVKPLKAAPITEFKAKDIFRAAMLTRLTKDNSHVAENIVKIKKGVRLSPILLVRDSPNGKVIIADGYHRMCAVYTFNEDAVIPCKIV